MNDDDKILKVLMSLPAIMEMKSQILKETDLDRFNRLMNEYKVINLEALTIVVSHHIDQKDGKEIRILSALFDDCIQIAQHKKKISKSNERLTKIAHELFSFYGDSFEV